MEFNVARGIKETSLSIINLMCAENITAEEGWTELLEISIMTIY